MTLTERLQLDPLDRDHTDQVHAIYSDPETWRHLPTGRFTDPAKTAAMIERARRSWLSVGLGPWAVRLRPGVAEPPIPDPDDPDPDDPDLAGPDRPVIGTAGCALLGVPAWNLGYRFTPAAWGHGYATEAGVAALAAARQARPDVPVTARALTANPASIRVLERIGLTQVWRGRTAESGQADPDDTRGIERVITADRPLEPALLSALIDLG